jgi:hypothetical protein
MPELSGPTKKLIERAQSYLNKKEEDDDSPVIHVDEIAKKVASFYDKIRGIIDWKGEHLLRRNAIERTLRRKTLPKVSILKEEKREVDAKSLVLELIRAGHLPNDTIKKSKIKEVQQSLDKYVYILNNLPTKEDNDYKAAIYQWLTSIAACEVEEVVNPSRIEKFLLDYMSEQMKEKIKLENGAKKLDKRTKETLIFIATQRALFGLDEPIITYHLFKHNYPKWNKLPQKDLKAITNKIYKIREKVDDYFNHKLEAKFYQLCKAQSTPYLLIGDILKENGKNPEDTFSEPAKLEQKIKSVYRKRVDTLKARLSRSAAYATISIFITNVAALYVLEIPLAKMINWQAETNWTWEIFGMNYPISAILGTILVPTLIMAAFVLTVSPPPKENLHKVIIETMNVIYKKDKVNHLKVKEHRKRGFVSNLLINFVWILSTVITLGLIMKVLTFLNFPPLSYVIFIIFLSLIGFAGTKIRERSKELHMLIQKEGLANVILDIFALPMIRLGKWFTNKWKKYNIISVFFSALVDLPFMSFVRFLEQWRGFLKEKREDIY